MTWVSVDAAVSATPRPARASDVSPLPPRVPYPACKPCRSRRFQAAGTTLGGILSGCAPVRCRSPPHPSRGGACSRHTTFSRHPPVCLPFMRPINAAAQRLRGPRTPLLRPARARLCFVQPTHASALSSPRTPLLRPARPQAATAASLRQGQPRRHRFAKASHGGIAHQCARRACSGHASVSAAHAAQQNSRAKLPSAPCIVLFLRA